MGFRQISAINSFTPQKFYLDDLAVEETSRFGVVGYDLVLRRLGVGGTREVEVPAKFGCSFWVNFKEHGGSDFNKNTHTHNLLALNVCGPFFLGWFWNQAFWWVFVFWGESTVQDFWQ